MTDLNDPSGTATAVKDQAAGVAHDAKQAGERVAGTTREEVGNVAREASGQARKLLHQVNGELADQAGEGQKRVAGGLRSMGDELRSMGESSEQRGIASDLASQAADRLNSAAEWLDQREPGSLLNEVKSFARQRPGLFIAISAGAGVLAGRLTKALVDSAKEGEAPAASGAAGDLDSMSTEVPAPAPAATAPLYEETRVETIPEVGGDLRS